MHHTAMNTGANPFASAAALRHSGYSASHNGRLERLLDSRRSSPEAEFANITLRAAILHPDFPCVGSKAAVNRGRLRTAHYTALADPAVTHGLARDLFAFVRDQQHEPRDAEFSSFVATFGRCDDESEIAFENAVWRQLSLLSELDGPHHRWDAAVSSDPSSPQFAYSFGTMAFFVVGMYRWSARWARRLPFAALAFNPRRQFDRLRAEGTFARMQSVVRAADIRLQGSVNPMVAGGDAQSEARQYSGRAVEPNWRCPFVRARQ